MYYTYGYNEPILCCLYVKIYYNNILLKYLNFKRNSKITMRKLIQNHKSVDVK